jgi:5-methylthioadenosine/S-adenosylhomocysteine deaminase
MISFQADPQGGSRQVVTGDIVTMNERRQVLRGGRVCIDGSTIAAVLAPDEPLPAGFEAVTPVDSGGTIYPGLIDLHNHLTYNMLPLWTVPKRYSNRNQWRTEEASYQSDIARPASLLARHADLDYTRAIIRYAECRSLFGGVTTAQGMSLSSTNGMRKLFEGLVRNVEQPIDAGWPAAGTQTLDYDPAEIKTKLVPALATGLPFFYHLSEGTDRAARQRFRDLRLHNGSWAVAKSMICIHCVGLRGKDFNVIKGSAGIVWSPTSNLLLYGRTADVAAAKSRGVPIALGADWSPSGCKNLLGELKVARAVSTKRGRLFSPRDLVEMVTCTPAAMLGWQKYLGAVAPGRRADLLIIAGSHHDPYTALIDASEPDLRAILIDGRIRMGEAGSFTVGDPASSERFTIGGRDFYLDLVEPSEDGMAGMTLAGAIAKLTHGLAHLPQLAAEQPPPMAMMAASAQPAWRLDLEMDDDHGHGDPASLTMAFAAGAPPPAPVRPMTLEPITAADDAGFIARLSSNPNLPGYVKKSLQP